MRKALVVVTALLVPVSAAAQWPLPKDAPPSAHADAGSWPSDPRYGEEFWLWSHSGETASVDRAWSITRGSPNVVIAIAGAGVSWRSLELANKWALNEGELPAPSTSTDGGHDVNGDGRFNAQDFTSATGTTLPSPATVTDARLSARADKGDTNGNGFIDPQDLLNVFQDGVDGDGNGLTDDVCGYDFSAGDADAESANELNDDTRGAELAAAQANDGYGIAGACPECMLVPLRVGELGAPSTIAAAIRASRASVIVLASPPYALTKELRDAIAMSDALVIYSPSPRPGARFEPLDAVTDALRAEPVDQLAAMPPFAPTPLIPSVRVGPAHAPGAVLSGIAGLLFSIPGANRSSVREVLLSRKNARAAVDDFADPARRFVQAIIEPTPLANLEVGPVKVTLTAEGGPRTFVVEAAPGIAPASFTEFFRVGADGGEGIIQPSQLVFPPPLLARDPNSQTMTVRVRAEATRADGGVSTTEERRTVYFTQDRALHPPFPVTLDGAGATALKLVDVNGDSSDELVVVTADALHVLDDTGGPLFAPVPVKGFAPPAVSNFGIVVAGLDGRITALNADGTAVNSFPITLDRSADGGTATRLYAAPVLIPSEHGPLIIQGDSEGHLHVLLDDGTELRGSPVEVGTRNSPVVAPPAVSDVDGDGSPDIIVGTAELYPSASQTRLHRLEIGPAGVEEISDFNVRLSAEPSFADRLFRQGVVSAPIIGNLDRAGLREIAVRSTGSALTVLRHDGTIISELSGSEKQRVPSMAAIADLDKDGPFELIDYEGAALKAWSVGKNLVATGGDPGIGEAELLENFPKTLPAPALSGFVVGDVDGDREADVVFASEDPVVHAISSTGKPIDGWPRLLPGGSNAHVAMGVMGNRLVVAALTRDGRIYVWDVLGTPKDIQWDSFHHDPANTGSTGTPLPTRSLSGIGDRDTPPPPPESCCSTSPSYVSLTGFGALLFLLKLARLRRRD